MEKLNGCFVEKVWIIDSIIYSSRYEDRGSNSSKHVLHYSERNVCIIVESLKYLFYVENKDTYIYIYIHIILG